MSRPTLSANHARALALVRALRVDRARRALVAASSALHGARLTLERLERQQARTARRIDALDADRRAPGLHGADLADVSRGIDVLREQSEQSRRRIRLALDEVESRMTERRQALRDWLSRTDAEARGKMADAGSRRRDAERRDAHAAESEQEITVAVRAALRGVS